MKKYSIYLLLTLMPLTNNCNCQPESRPSIGGFDISRDDKLVIYSLGVNKQTAIHVMRLDSGQDEILSRSTAGKSLARPRYSPDGQKIVFVEYDYADLKNTSLCIADADGTNIQRLLEGQGIVSEAVFSRYRNEILFTKANEYTKSSPVGRKAAHDYDIYSIDLSSREISRLSNLRSYSFQHLFELDSSQILFYTFEPKKGGMVLLNRNRPSELKRIVPANNPRGDATLYYSPVYSEKTNRMAFIAPYQIYTMDVETRIASLLFDGRGGAHIDYISFFHDEQKLMFVVKNDPHFYIISLDGTGLEKIPVTIH